MLLMNILLFTVAVVAAPPRFPLPDGFPNPSPAQLLSIQKAAGGFFPSTPLARNLTPTAIAAIQLLANNEFYEAAFFSELLTNLTTNVPGYRPKDIYPLDHGLLIKSITAIKNQEELHAIGANAILASAKQQPLAPCQYTFPVTNFKNAILFAQTFTDLALGTVPEIQLQFALDGGDEPRNSVTLGSILAQEGQQDGFFRYAQRKTPSAAPYLTGGAVAFAFDLLQKLIVPNSCPKPLSDLGFKAFESSLWIETPKPEPSWPSWLSVLPPKNATLTFSSVGLEDGGSGKYSLVYLSGQNAPLAVPTLNYHREPGSTIASFHAEFPFETNFANGLTIAVVTLGNGPFKDAAAVANATISGTAVIEVN
ncbi:MAG: hypothetical protein Q9182_003096 [Xanthomendoza sp. 2 TL-2023]